MPIRIEQRARSFAGEFLLPGRTAAGWWEAAGGPRNLEGLRAVLIELERHFAVPRAVSAWKLEHGLQARGHRGFGVLLQALSPYR